MNDKTLIVGPFGIALSTPSIGEARITGSTTVPMKWNGLKVRVSESRSIVLFCRWIKRMPRLEYGSRLRERMDPDQHREFAALIDMGLIPDASSLRWAENHPTQTIWQALRGELPPIPMKDHESGEYVVRGEADL